MEKHKYLIDEKEFNKFIKEQDEINKKYKEIEQKVFTISEKNKKIRFNY